MFPDLSTSSLNLVFLSLCEQIPSLKAQIKKGMALSRCIQMSRDKWNKSPMLPSPSNYFPSSYSTTQYLSKKHKSLCETSGHILQPLSRVSHPPC